MLSRNPYDQGKFLYVNLKKLSHNRLDTLLIPHVSAEAPFSLSTRREGKITAVSRIFFFLFHYRFNLPALYADFIPRFLNSFQVKYIGYLNVSMHIVNTVKTTLTMCKAFKF